MARAGVVIAIGGAEDKLRDRVILERFVQLAGGTKARVAVLSTASSLGDEATELYAALFGREGATHITGLRPVSREEANRPDLARTVADSTGVFMTGGNQLRLASVVGGTRLGEALLEAHRRGAVIGGTSAGASAISSHMVAFGSAGASPKHRMVQLASGLGLLPGVVIDQHFEQRNRLGRLLAAIAQSPGLLGIGIDEDTAIVVDDGVLEVLGKGAATIVDGASLVTDAFVTKGHRPMMVSGATLHSLPSGWRFDLRERVLVPAREEGAAARTAARMTFAGERARRLIRRIASEGADDQAPARAARRRARPRVPREEASE
ncbi:MAG: cyanophycinase [Actinobacteria bacterium]|nr:cyanophycinase [Actinomycetota bacterium]